MGVDKTIFGEIRHSMSTTGESFFLNFLLLILREDFEVLIQPHPVTEGHGSDNFPNDSSKVMEMKHCYRSDEIHANRPVPFRKQYFSVFDRPFPSRLHFLPRQTCQNSTVPFCLEYHQPWKALIFCVPASVLGSLSLLADECQRKKLESWLGGYVWEGRGCWWVSGLLLGSSFCHHCA